MTHKAVVAALNSLMVKTGTIAETRIGVSEALVAFLQV